MQTVSSAGKHATGAKRGKHATGNVLKRLAGLLCDSVLLTIVGKSDNALLLIIQGLQA